jgi:hypothetical protein
LNHQAKAIHSIVTFSFIFENNFNKKFILSFSCM